MDTGVSFWLAGFVLNLSGLHVDDVEGVYVDLPELDATAWNLVAEGDIVARISHCHQDQYRLCHTKHRTFHGFSRVAPSSDFYSTG